MIRRLTQMKLDQAKRKLAKETTEGLPYAVYVLDGKDLTSQHDAIHWHKEFEIAMILEGSTTSFIDNKEVSFHKGECLFINSNVIHGSTGLKESVNLSVFFDPAFIAGTERRNAYWDKYIWPIIKEESIRFLVLSETIPWQKKCIDLARRVYELAEQEPLFFEFDIRQTLTEFLRMLYEHCESERYHTSQTETDHLLTTMFDYISNNYKEHITVGDVANAANISKRECYRKFDEYMDVPPNVYVNAFRIQQACKLLTESEQSITDICFNVGFSSCSYFSTKFKQIMGCSPQDFRKGVET